MQVRCSIYGLMNASSGVECSIDRDLLEVGEYFHYQDQDYIIVSVVESRGRWFANVVPENQRRFMPPVSRQRFPGATGDQQPHENWRERAAQAERKVRALQEERAHVGERLDRLMHMLELLMKESDNP